MKPKINAIPVFNLVRQYAQSRGLFFFTWEQQKIAFRLYAAEAEKKN